MKEKLNKQTTWKKFFFFSIRKTRTITQEKILKKKIEKFFSASTPCGKTVKVD